MPEYVSREVIDMRVVNAWARFFRHSVEERADDINVVQPFPPFNQTFSEVMDDVRNGTHQGIVFYRYMVRLMPGYDFTSSESQLRHQSV